MSRGQPFLLILILLGVMLNAIISSNPVSYMANKDIDVNIQDYNGEIVSYFLINVKQNTSLTSDVNKTETSVEVVDNTGCVVGDAINIYDNDSFFQGIITAVGVNNIDFVLPLDTSFSTSNTFVQCGEWNMNVDGSVNPIDYEINPPTSLSWDIESIGMIFKDNSDWDINTFGSRTSLTNGFSVSVVDGYMKQLFLIYNNGGFTLRGGIVQNFERAPSGLYGFTVDMMFDDKYGAVLELNGRTNDKMLATISDDLTTQTEIAFIVRGHIKDE